VAEAPVLVAMEAPVQMPVVTPDIIIKDLLGETDKQPEQLRLQLQQ
jgi:hypothetical protein